MITRVALLAASLTASAVLALGLALAGVGPSTPGADPFSTATTVVDSGATTDAPPAPITQIDTVYVVPTPPPTPAPTPPTIVIQKVVTVGGGDDGENGD
jgi:hypothetical protein